MEINQYYHLKKKSILKIFNVFKNIIFTNSASISININKKDHFFPADFFEPISQTKSIQIKPINDIIKNKTKITYVSLQKEDEEDKELLDLLDGKCKKKN